MISPFDIIRNYLCRYVIALKKGYRQLTDLAKSDYGAFPTTAIAARESWLKILGTGRSP